MKVAWFSGGATSAVACKLALQKYNDVEICYIETGSHHPDMGRFLKDCERWFNKEVTILKSRYKDHFDVIERTGVIRMPRYAPCTEHLKVRVRQEFEYNHPEITHYIWGFEKGSKEEARAERISERYPDYKHLFPLIESNLDKNSCLALLEQQGIKFPEMYKLGYSNNNCIGCVKGGMFYWNKIRKDFPEVFDRMMKLERKIGHHCLKECFLDELPEGAGRDKPVMPQCSIFCNFVNFDNEVEDDRQD